MCWRPLAVILEEFHCPVDGHLIHIFERPAGGSDQGSVNPAPVDFPATGRYSPGLAARIPPELAMAPITCLKVPRSSMSSNCSGVTSG